MKPKHKRLVFIVISMSVMALGVSVILTSLRDTIIFFYTPTQLLEKRQEAHFDHTHAIRIGGLVKQGSVTNLKTGGIRFIITDLSNEIPATYHGLLPSLFRDGQGVVAQGTLDAEGTLQAKTILAKHDENYMPREVVDALKASGQWQEVGTITKEKP